MKVVFVDKFENYIVKKMEYIPPMEAKICMGYLPLCTVNEITLFPNEVLELTGKINTGKMASIMINAEVLIRVK